MNRDPASDENFDAAFETAAPRLQRAVRDACHRQAEWPARVAAAIYATLDFAVAEPEAICALTRDALTQRPDGPSRYLEQLERFASLLHAEAPGESQLPAFTEQALIGAIAITIADHLRAGTLDRLREAGPELVELTLRPYLGREEARRRSRRSVGD
jgi:hypothetical protein